MGVTTEGVLPIMLNGEATPERGTFFRPQVYELQVEVYIKDWGNVSFQSVKRHKRANGCISWLWKIRENVLALCFIHI